MFKGYQIKSLFDWQNGNTDLKKEHINGKGYPVVSSGIENMGVIGCTDVDARILPACTITVDMFGNVYYRDFEYKEVTHARVFTLIPKGFALNDKTGLYFVTILQKITRMFSYNNMCSYTKISNMVITLPVIANPDHDHEYTVDDIDWQYMRDRIAKLEQERIAELDVYLKVTGLDDYTLTDEDKKILSNAAQHEFKKFKVKDVFDVSPVNRITEPNKSYIPDDEIIGQGGNTPYIAAISKNNGITGYSYREPNNMGDCVTLSTTAASPDTVFYQPDAFIGRQQMSAFRRKDGNPLGYGCGIYLATLVRKLTIGFNYGNKLTNDFLKNTTISLPVIESSDPDHEYTVDDIDWQDMERYIRAMEKVVIADAVKYKDRVIDETRKLVS